MSKYTRIELFMKFAFHNGLETSRIHSSLEGTVIALCFMIVIGASVQVFWLKGHRPAVVFCFCQVLLQFLAMQLLSGSSSLSSLSPALQKEKMHGNLIAQFMLFCSAYGAYYEVLQQKVEGYVHISTNI